MPFVNCSVCEGDRFVTVIGSGTFSMSAEQWYPDEHEEVCDRCDGTGREFVEGNDDF
jgi:hypothetical protein